MLPATQNASPAEGFVSYILNPSQVDVSTTTNNPTWASVNLTFGSSAVQVLSWGGPVRQGNTITVNLQMETWTGLSAQVITHKSQMYNLGNLPAGTYTLQINCGGALVKEITFNVLAPSAASWLAVAQPNAVNVSVKTPDPNALAPSSSLAQVTLALPSSGNQVLSWSNAVRCGNIIDINITGGTQTGLQTPAIGHSQSHIYDLGNLPTGAYTLRIFVNGGIEKTLPFTA